MKLYIKRVKLYLLHGKGIRIPQAQTRDFFVIQPTFFLDAKRISPATFIPYKLFKITQIGLMCLFYATLFVWPTASRSIIDISQYICILRF